MPLGLTITLVMLSVMGILGALGYLMDKLVNRDEREDDR